MTLITLPPQANAVVPEFSMGDRLRKAREHAGLEQVDLAKTLGIHRQTISRYERNAAMPIASVIVVWALVTQVDLLWLQTGCTPRDSNSEPTDSRFKDRRRPRREIARTGPIAQIGPVL
jgi:transcriptional regulator with XRE-family HTH domain